MSGWKRGTPLAERKWITTTIKWSWLEMILSGEKTIEYKVAKEFWRVRLDKLIGLYDVPIGINFIVKKKAYKFEVTKIVYREETKKPFIIDGMETYQWYEIHLGKRLS